MCMTSNEAANFPKHAKVILFVAGLAVKLILDVIREVFVNIRVAVNSIPSTKRIIL